MHTSSRRKLQFLGHQVRAIMPSSLKRANRGREIALVIATAHKVGSTWVYRMLRDLHVFREWVVPKRYRANAKNLGLLALDRPGVKEYLKNARGFRIFKTHSVPPDWERPEKVRFVTVFRDPRDVVVSNIFYLANLSPELGGWPELKKLGNSERIAMYLERGSFDLELLKRWYSYGDCYKIYYEHLLKDPMSELARLIGALGLVVPTKEQERIVRLNSFSRLSEGRAPGQENASSFFRKGVAGDWKNYFGPREVECFKTARGGEWNELLVNLGYEDDAEWQLEPTAC